MELTRIFVRMETCKLKQKLLEKCIQQQSEILQHLQKEIDEAQNQANEYGQPKDRYDAYRTKLMRQIELYSKQLDKANVVMAALQKVPVDKKCHMVEYGALVITDRQKMFISAGVGKVELNGEIFFAVSATVPIVQALAGKRKGEEAVFNGVKYKIEDIC